ncbi:DNA-binding transcriptional regulator, CsgD family [Sphingomonas sp. NFR04]|uniref:helix-turn-helix transcriptional regulator n=1 Tax=Sphingomonas sp. NFR04 TaxID=1566283 RepID=UPI0008EFAC50|nr:LuxR family transcriptional regulator [Sphingomonas sp. NFR04]SFK05656.1 DNA-binding transcriptional regulator, CsgD family [Sphingomonas sp. NFR04]
MTAAVSHALLTIAADFGAASDVDQLCARFSAAVASVGNFHFALGRFGPNMLRGEEVIFVHYPEAWQRHYHANDYIKIDPTINAISHRDIPYSWAELGSLDAAQRRLLDEARAFGVVAGFTVPIHMTDGTTFVASFGADNVDALNRARPFLSMISAQFLERYKALAATPKSPIRLTPRERDCMTWTARGKSAWEIGILLGISENTVNFHVKNACAKLGSNGRMLAVVSAIMLGVISP